MSDLTECCFCSLRWMQAAAADRGAEVVVQKEVEGEMAGWTSARYSDKEKPSAYFMALTTQCAC